MGSESGLWNTLAPKLRPFGALHRVENRVEAGMPDLHYILRRKPGARAACGWLELKYEAAWPAQDDGAVHIKMLTLEQVNWHLDYAALGGRVGTLAQFGRSYVLLDALLLARVYKRTVTRAEVIAAAPLYDPTTLPVGRLIRCLTT
jgi:hypothetical protein